ncbi:hypothetical protein HOO65_020331 [Ceratocystis lukuohia]|uniref:Uncharacterized protein n=3 Tax=Ceratocystis TaxID=5157 RepID=A0A0F8B3F8_CERFI|nr:hypothetical protein CFO_g3119 [Ceratocystis platani]PHH54290.1 hypothetical protein CFIMG_007976RA00001 [Ceratocystis fimbriata CBS 114723]
MAEATPIISHGRGGAGNMFPEGPQDAAEQVHSAHPASHDDAVVSTGRGGAGNMVDGDVAAAALKQEEGAAVQRASAENEPYSQGRGGAGNIVVPENDKQNHTTPAATDGAAGKATTAKGSSTGLIARLKAKFLQTWRRVKA